MGGGEITLIPLGHYKYFFYFLSFHLQITDYNINNKELIICKKNYKLKKTYLNISEKLVQKTSKNTPKMSY